MVACETGILPRLFLSSFESKNGCHDVRMDYLSSDSGLTGNVPSARMCLRAFRMSGIDNDSAQSQSRRSCFFGSLPALQHVSP